MENSIAMTRMPSVAPPSVEHPPRPSGRQLDSEVQTDPSRVVILVESTDTGGVVRSIPPEVVQYLPAARDADRQALAELKA